MNADETLNQEWASIAEAWIRVMNDDEDPHRAGLLDEWMMRAVGDVAGLRVVDLGCGEGRFCRMLAERGASVVGIDPIARFIEHANAHKVGDETYVLGDAQCLDSVADNSFDLAVSYVSLVDMPDFASAVSEAHRVLRCGGRFIVCNLQPMNTAANCWMNDGTGAKLHFKLDSYFDESSREMAMRGGKVKNFHRTLSTYINGFLGAGFRLDGIREPKPSPEQVAKWPKIADNLRVPYFIIYLLGK